MSALDSSREIRSAGQAGGSRRRRGGGIPRARLVWTAGLIVYALAVAQRTSLSSAGLDATHRFGISPGALSLFVLLQVGVYSAGQIPAGLLVDRFGPRWVLVGGGLVLGGAQILLAFAGSVGTAVAARIGVGLGDTVVFASMLALIPNWFPARRVPLMTQTTTIIGQVGQILSAVPLLLLLRTVGWSPSFAIAGAASLLSGVIAGLVVRNRGLVAKSVDPEPERPVLSQVRAVWRRPGSRLAFFGHLGTQFSMMTFSVLWGMPYLVSAQGMTPVAAGWMMTALVLASACVGPVLGMLTARYPRRRSWLLLGIIGATISAWTAVLAVPGPAPRWLLGILIVVLSLGGPGSVVGFDIARTTNPHGSLAVAQGMVNLAGYSASLVLLTAIGWVLTRMGGYTADGFRVAWLLQYPIWTAAIVGILLSRRKARLLR